MSKPWTPLAGVSSFPEERIGPKRAVVTQRLLIVRRFQLSQSFKWAEQGGPIGVQLDQEIGTFVKLASVMAMVALASIVTIAFFLYHNREAPTVPDWGERQILEPPR